MKLNLMNCSLSVSFEDCPRCKQSHSFVQAIAFQKPVAGGWTHFAMCQTMQQPVLLRLAGEDEP